MIKYFCFFCESENLIISDKREGFYYKVECKTCKQHYIIIPKILKDEIKNNDILFSKNNIDKTLKDFKIRLENNINPDFYKELNNILERQQQCITTQEERINEIIECINKYYKIK